MGYIKELLLDAEYHQDEFTNFSDAIALELQMRVENGLSPDDYFELANYIYDKEIMKWQKSKEIKY